MQDMLANYERLLQEDKYLVQVLYKTLLLRRRKHNKLPLLLAYLDGLLQSTNQTTVQEDS